jgi:alpha-L-rhamnosidase
MASSEDLSGQWSSTRRCLSRGVVFAAAVFGALASAAAPASHLAQPNDLRSAGQTDPLAVADDHPEFSWRLDAAHMGLHGVAQTAYQIQVAAKVQVAGSESQFASVRAKSAQGILWDSGIVQSSATSGIRYAGAALEAGREYTWRVQVWDEGNRPSGWSAAAHWTQAPEWRAQWIAAPSDDGDDAHEPLPLFRKAFSVSHRVTRALLYASGLGQDEIRVNGHKVSADELTPGWSDYRKTVYYDAYDVTPLLLQGRNAIGVMLGNGMYRVLSTPGRFTKFVGSFGDLKCTVQLELSFADGSSAEILSDGTWKTSPGPITFSSTYGGEDFDARLEPQGWDRAGFDDNKWYAVSVVAGPGGALIPELAPPIRETHVYSPIKVTHPKPGITVYDLGQNFAGWPEITVSGRRGAEVKLVAGELLDKDGLAWQRSSGNPQWYSYTLRGGGMETWHPRFSYYGFRYVQVESNKTGATEPEFRVLSLRGDEIHSSSEQVGEFATSDDLLNRIHLLILHAIENNSMSLFTDCPHREKLGWLEETHLMAPSLLDNFDFAELYAATARNIADAQRRDGPKAGMVPEIAPQYMVFEPKWDMFNDTPEWGSAAILDPWYVYERTGNKDFVANQYEVMRAYAAYLGTRAHDGIIDYGLGDWYDIGPGDPGLSKLTTAGVTATAIYYRDLKVMEKTAALLGRKDESEEYARQGERVKDAFNAKFFDAAQHRYDKGSQTAQAMPLALGIVPDGERGAVLNALVADIRAHQNHTTSGEVGFRYEVDALLESGRSDVLLDMFKRSDAPSYGYILAQGATSLTEAWDGGHSQDHFMLGDAEEWFYRGPGGIDVDFSRPVAERIVLHPVVVGKIAWVRTSYRSAAGMIASSWQRGAQTTVYRFTVPANAMATIEIDSGDPNSAMVNGVAAAKAAGVVDSRVEGGRITLIAGSGEYEIRAENPVH